MTTFGNLDWDRSQLVVRRRLLKLPLAPTGPTPPTTALPGGDEGKTLGFREERAREEKKGFWPFGPIDPFLKTVKVIFCKKAPLFSDFTSRSSLL